MFNNVYKGKTVLVTGHTGFKGSWLSIWLNEIGAKVVGFALDPASEKGNFVLAGLTDKMVDVRGDVRDIDALSHVFKIHSPDFVFHLAAQPLVRLSYEEPVKTFETNVMGTINVLECIRRTDREMIGIMVTSDKCYENKEQIWGYRESDPMGGHDPYSSSKGAAEIAISSWRRSYFNPSNHRAHGKSIASVRAGNVIGGGDWARDRIVPDCMRAIESGSAIEIRSPEAVRPWEHVLEPISGYLLLGQRMIENPGRYCEGWNFGPSPESIVTVWEMASRIVQEYGSGRLVDMSGDRGLHEATLLALDISKARATLGWKPTLNLDETIRTTVDWYREYRDGDVYGLCTRQIGRFMAKRGK